MTRRWAALAIFALALVLQTCAPAHHLPSLPAPAPREQIDVSLFLIGDAGAAAAPPKAEPVLAALQAAVAQAPSPLIVFLGDNIYPRGMPDSSAPERSEAVRRLDAQLSVARATGTHAIFVPGNHDWDRFGPDGWAAVQRSAAVIAASPGGLATQLPDGGCPGPAVVDVGATVRLIALDTQWWLQHGAKPVHPTSTCRADAPGEVIDSLQAAALNASGRVVIVLGHHPLRTGGPHGGHFGWSDHLFPLRELNSWLWIPLPIIGSAYPIARASGISSQDVSSKAYGTLIDGLDSAFSRTRPLVYAAGHEHGLQVIRGGGASYLLASGGGIYGHASHIVWLDSTLYARGASGFMRLEVLRDRRARLAVTVVDREGHGTEAFGLWLQ
ncbi:MAG TPA: metallophosphoesterase [Gemmatimonadales bacterium]|nr:metallophosphoesterase [Gemmatimonadales bacterium]